LCSKELRRGCHDSRSPKRPIGDPSVPSVPELLSYDRGRTRVPVSRKIFQSPLPYLQQSTAGRKRRRRLASARASTQPIYRQQLTAEQITRDAGFQVFHAIWRPVRVNRLSTDASLQPPNRDSHSKNEGLFTLTPSFLLRLPLWKGRRGFPHLVGPSFFGQNLSVIAQALRLIQAPPFSLRTFASSRLGEKQTFMSRAKARRRKGTLRIKNTVRP
jgi:hypothetical protein